ncbi:NYN domain-containing protein [Patescibacteria group bacterium]|nr:NYN domain-containing protein [Patescibacteria group bacterium]MBU4162391.1 NYN domain-containing protein [Patescibacteria group bacterium]
MFLLQQKFIDDVRKRNYDVHTKPVKIMKLSIDVSSIPINSPALLENFIRKPLLKEFNLETIEILNKKLKELNNGGIRFIQDKKCNFDVEIGRDMLIDYDKNGIENFILWSGDSDFSDPIDQLLKDGKKVVVFSTARRVSIEISDTGVRIFEIKKIRDFICWPKESQKDPFQGP